MKKIRFKWKIHPAGLAVFALAFFLLDSHMVIAASAALLLHEAAHMAAMLLCGAKECTIELTPFGGMADLRDFEAYSPIKQLIIAAAGVAASAACAAACLHFQKNFYFVKAFFQANASLAMLNILPCWPLDGARMIAAIASAGGYENQVRKVLSVLSRMLGVTFVLIALYGVWHGVVNLSLLVIGPYLWYAAQSERVAHRVYRFDQAEVKLNAAAVFPVNLWATGNDLSPEKLSVLLGKTGEKRYHIFIRIDRQTGRLLRCMTEDEILNQLLSLEGIDAHKA